MNAGGVDKACKSSAFLSLVARSLLLKTLIKKSGERVSNTLVTYPEVRHSSPKGGVIPDSVRLYVGLKEQFASGGT